jgi:hypothetical protein
LLEHIVKHGPKGHIKTPEVLNFLSFDHSGLRVGGEIPARIERFREASDGSRLSRNPVVGLALVILASLSTAGRGSGWTVPRTPWGAEERAKAAPK